MDKQPERRLSHPHGRRSSDRLVSELWRKLEELSKISAATAEGQNDVATVLSQLEAAHGEQEREGAGEDTAPSFEPLEELEKRMDSLELEARLEAVEEAVRIRTERMAGTISEQNATIRELATKVAALEKEARGLELGEALDTRLEEGVDEGVDS